MKMKNTTVFKRGAPQFLVLVEKRDMLKQDLMLYNSNSSHEKKWENRIFDANEWLCQDSQKCEMELLSLSIKPSLIVQINLLEKG